MLLELATSILGLVGFCDGAASIEAEPRGAGLRGAFEPDADCDGDGVELDMMSLSLTRNPPQSPAIAAGLAAAAASSSSSSHEFTCMYTDMQGHKSELKNGQHGQESV